jgi:flagellar basal-body rod modification protein FlgD
MNVSNATSSAALATVPKESQLGQNDFLELMVAQFQNQDPFKPMENGDFLGQMAQFSTVSGLQELNDRFDGLAQAIGGDQSIGAASLIGRQGLFDTNQVQTTQAGESVQGAVESYDGAPVMVDVTDASGQLVRSISVSPSGPGMTHFQWDGLLKGGKTAAAGEYYMNARSAGASGDTELPILIAGRIQGVALGGALGTSLNVQGLGEQPLSAVRELNDRTSEGETL